GNFLPTIRELKKLIVTILTIFSYNNSLRRYNMVANPSVNKFGEIGFKS
ncbi:hypothetical protein HMPREF1403_00109, partial [Helicobacter pylori GAM201Ai]